MMMPAIIIRKPNKKQGDAYSKVAFATVKMLAKRAYIKKTKYIKKPCLNKSDQLCRNFGRRDLTIYHYPMILIVLHREN